MDIRKGDIVAWPTNLGWMMGPWLVYASLLNGATIALYNGAPLGSGFAKFVQVDSTFPSHELAFLIPFDAFVNLLVWFNVFVLLVLICFNFETSNFVKHPCMAYRP